MPRHYNTSTRLGQTMAAEGWDAGEFAIACGVNPRTMTEYLAGRKVILREHLWRMAEELGVEPDEIDNGDEVDT